MRDELLWHSTNLLFIKIISCDAFKFKLEASWPQDLFFVFGITLKWGCGVCQLITIWFEDEGEDSMNFEILLKLRNYKFGGLNANCLVVTSLERVVVEVTEIFSTFYQNFSFIGLNWWIATFL